jgi:hypothetical protein
MDVGAEIQNMVALPPRIGCWMVTTADLDTGSLLLLLRPEPWSIYQANVALSFLTAYHTNRFKNKGQDYMPIYSVELKQNIFPKQNRWDNLTCSE